MCDVTFAGENVYQQALKVAWCKGEIVSTKVTVHPSHSFFPSSQLPHSQKKKKPPESSSVYITARIPGIIYQNLIKTCVHAAIHMPHTLQP